MLRMRSDRQPIFCRVQSDERRLEVAEICDLYGWYFMIDVDASKPENIDELERALDGEVLAARSYAYGAC